MQLAEKVDGLYETIEQMDRETYSLQAKLATAEQRAKTEEEAKTRIWNIHLDDIKEKNVLRKRISVSTVKGIAWTLLGTAVGVVTGKLIL
jgi:hypothetical protein